MNNRFTIRRSRRNLLRIGVLAASAMTVALTRAKPTEANPPHEHVHDRRGHGPVGERNCYLQGTTIQTVAGDRRVEDLSIGDLLPTVFGGIRPVQWIESYRVVRSQPSETWDEDVLPIRVSRSALGPDLPRTDLYLTKAHALLINGILVPVASLVNGDTIAIDEARERDELEYFHVKLETHDVIYAEGAPCETLLAAHQAPCAPELRFNGGRSEMAARLRSAFSPLIDCRTKLDMIRDDLEEAGILRIA